MRKTLLFLVIFSILLGLPGCYATQVGLPSGTFYAGGSSAWSGNYEHADYREGKACATSYGGYFAFGDATIATAASRGGITHVTSVSHEVEGWAGFKQDFCVIVRGYRQ
ncbi:MAG: hypothetical protein KDK30_06440 [Leptospiraceae bacterium]|nr:hypothetical protein [Leptospiraceae bacterium]